MAESHGDEAQRSLEEPAGAGMRLRLAREALGLSSADIAATTKIPERHIAAIEDGNFGALAGRSYAIGFSRSYARAVGLDEQEIIRQVRQELGDVDAQPEHRNAFEPGDPSRIPSKRVAWLAALIALGVVIGMLFFWRGRSEPVADPGDIAFSNEDAAAALTASDPAIVPGAGPTDALPAIPGDAVFGAPVSGGSALGGSALGGPVLGGSATGGAVPGLPAVDVGQRQRQGPVRLDEMVVSSAAPDADPGEAVPDAAEAEPPAPPSTVSE